MKDEITALLLQDKARFRSKGLFGGSGDSLSIRVPGQNEYLLIDTNGDEVRTESFATSGHNPDSIHAAVYGSRADAGAILIGQAKWSTALASLSVAIPTLFDEQARHIGKVGAPVQEGQIGTLLDTLSQGANVAIYGRQRICIGTTSDRVVFNAELFEKCAKAFVIAATSGARIRKIPGWVCYIAGGRLKKDQKRSAESYAAGRVPQGMNAY